MKTRLLISVFALFVFIVVIIGCSGGGSGGSDKSYTVTLELDETSSYDTIHVGTTGSLMSVDIPDDPLDGFQLGIPNGSYDEEIAVSVSYSPIISHSGNEYFDPVTPLISVENGGEYSDEIMTMKIPVEMEDDYHYMAFYYDETTGELEGIPELEHDDSSITIATRHFSNVVVNRMIVSSTLDSYNSDFDVTKDGWPFKNIETYLEPYGICSGMSASALYYYNEKKKKLNEESLFGRYDNSTQKLTLDDDQAIKLASVIQGDTDGNGDLIAQWHYIKEKMNDYFTYLLFIHSISLTGEPQYVAIFPDDNTDGHAMLVYKKTNNDLYVYDSNFPNKTDAKLEFRWDYDNESATKGEFKPYESQWSSNSAVLNFNKIVYIGKSAIIQNNFGSLWDKLDNKQMNNEFPYLEFNIIEENSAGIESSSRLQNGHKTIDSTVKIELSYKSFSPDARITTYINEEKVESSENSTLNVSLAEGNNRIGILVEAKVNSQWIWTDFKYFNIELEKDDDASAPPSSPQESSIIINNTYDEKVNVYIKKCGTNSCWSISSGSLEPGETGTHTVEQGEYTILIFVTGNTSVKWTRDITLSEEDYTYDFTSTQDCSLARVAIINQTQYTLYYRPREINISPWMSQSDPGEQTNFYLETEKSYTSWAQAYTGCPSGVNLSNECYTCWSEPINELNCQGDEWTVSGDGFTCPPN